jgi:hypothetical protein
VLAALFDAFAGPGVYEPRARAVVQETPDATWLALAGERGFVVLCKDDRIRRRPAELKALTGGKVRQFCLTNATLTFAEQAEWLLANRYRIIRPSRKPGPYVYGVYNDKIDKLWPKPSKLS